MALRQEQVVFLVVAVGLGWMACAEFGGSELRRVRRAASDAVPFEHFSVPDVSVALSNGGGPPFERELFIPPRDTRPLPPLELIEPPRLPLADLFPPTDPGLSPVGFGLLLRRQEEITEVPGLFNRIVALQAANDEDDEIVVREKSTTAELLAALRKADINPFEDETPAERVARYDGYRQTYDWIERTPGQVSFGRIENAKRFGLKTDSARAGESVLFVEIDPVTGIERLLSVGAPAISIERTSLVDFEFAATLANELELGRGRIGSDLTRSEFKGALALANAALTGRREAPRALEIAIELFELCSAYDPKDLRPRLGLAACLEAGFRFDAAFAEYEKLLAEFGHYAAVHVALAELEERFLLFDRARERYAQAVEVDRGSWEAQLGLGTFLLRRGDSTGAQEHLRLAERSAPSEPGLLAVRVAARVALADALFAGGDLEEAGIFYRRALSADPASQRGLAGLLAVHLLGGAGAQDAIRDSARAQTLGEGEGYELLLVRGMSAMLEGEFKTARGLLEQAVDVDPLRAHRPFTALSYLARMTGNDADAMGFIEQALEVEPRDAYAHYWRGRLLGRAEEFEGAREALLTALEQELDFEDALVALGDVAFRLGSFSDAERYLERAIAINPARSEVHALRGLNFLRLELVPNARAAFGDALAIDASAPTARAGQAWCAYLDGEPTQARVLLSEFEDGRRAEGEEDPWRRWAREQIARIDDHIQKVEWRDNLDRQRLINNWFSREGAGPTISMEGGAVKIQGVFNSEGRTQVYREYRASDFISFSANVWIDEGTRANAGVFVARERRRGREMQLVGEAFVGRHPDGSLQVRAVRQGQPTTTLDLEQPVPTGRWVRFTIERQEADDDLAESTGSTGGGRTGSAGRIVLTITMDGIILIEDLQVSSLSGANAPLIMGLTAEGKSGQDVRVLMDEVAVVYRGARD